MQRARPLARDAVRFGGALVWLCLAALPLASRANEASAAAAEPPVPALQRDAAREWRLDVPRPVRNATDALGLGRQRLALVVGNGRAGGRNVLDTAARDVQAVAAALRAAGFVVLLREDLGTGALRAELKEFRERLQPGGLGFVYVAALGAQVDGINLLVTRDTPLDPDAPPAAAAAALKGAALPLGEVVDALIGPPGSPRLLVVDAAWRHPALDRLPTAGLVEPRLPPGLMALFGHALGAARHVPAAAPLPTPPPTLPREIAATRFTQALATALTTPRLSGPQALQATRRALVEASGGELQPWIGGDTDDGEEFADLNLLDGLLPRSPEEAARDLLRKGAEQSLQRVARASGEQSVAEVLAGAVDPAPRAEPAAGDGTQSAQRAARATADGAADAARAASPSPPGLASAAQAVAGGAAQAATAVAATAATVAVVGAQGTATAAASQGLGAATSVLGSVAGNAMALATRGGASSEAPAAAQAVQAAANGAGARAAAPLAAAATTSATVPEAPPAPADARTPRALPLDGRTQRVGEAGERPVYRPRTNVHGYAEGDTYTYRVIDGWKGEATGTLTVAIEEVLSDSQLLANGAELAMDAQGRTTAQRRPDGSRSEFEPAEELFWHDAQRGQRRELRFVERFERPGVGRGEALWTGSASVGRLRTVELPAGRFEVLPIESSGWVAERVGNGPTVSRRWERTVWYAPRLGHPVAIDLEESDHMGRLLRRERIELLHAQLARWTP
jgi:hypothetical protein